MARDSHATSEKHRKGKRKEEHAESHAEPERPATPPAPPPAPAEAEAGEADDDNELRVDPALIEQMEQMVANRERCLKLIETSTARKDQVKREIYEKVLTDYRRQLSELEKSLEPLCEQLSDALRGIASLESDIQAEIEGVNDKLAEMRFRGDVGELSQEDLFPLEEESSRVLKRLQARVAIVEQVYEQCQKLLTPKQFHQATGRRLPGYEPEDDKIKEDLSDTAAGPARVREDAPTAMHAMEPEHEPPVEPEVDPAEVTAPEKRIEALRPDKRPRSSPRAAVVSESVVKPLEVDPVGEDEVDPVGEEEDKSPVTEAQPINTDEGQVTTDLPVRDDVLSDHAHVQLSDVFATGPTRAEDDDGDVRPPHRAPTQAEATVALGGMHAFLIIETGPGPEEPIPLGTEPFVIGRHPNCNLVFESPAISRRHAVVQREPTTTSYVLQDLSSGNGVMVNGTRIKGSAVLQSGDRISVGSYQLVFVEQVD